MTGQGRGGLRILRRISDYVKYDLREIVAPRPLPDPPGVQHTVKKVPLSAWPGIVRNATRMYLDSFDKAKVQAQLREAKGEEYVEPYDIAEEKKEWNDVMGELGTATKHGGSVLLPQVQKIYTERVASYKDAIGQFVAGYREALAEGPAPEQGAPSAKTDEVQRDGRGNAGAAISGARTGPGEDHAPAEDHSPGEETIRRRHGDEQEPAELAAPNEDIVEPASRQVTRADIPGSATLDDPSRKTRE